MEIPNSLKSHSAIRVICDVNSFWRSSLVCLLELGLSSLLILFSLQLLVAKMQVSSNLDLRLGQSASTFLLVATLGGEIDVCITRCNYPIVQTQVAPARAV